MTMQLYLTVLYDEILCNYINIYLSMCLRNQLMDELWCAQYLLFSVILSYVSPLVILDEDYTRVIKILYILF